MQPQVVAARSRSRISWPLCIWCDVRGRARRSPKACRPRCGTSWGASGPRPRSWPRRASLARPADLGARRRLAGPGAASEMAALGTVAAVVAAATVAALGMGSASLRTPLGAAPRVEETNAMSVGQVATWAWHPARPMAEEPSPRDMLLLLRAATATLGGRRLRAALRHLRAWAWASPTILRPSPATPATSRGSQRFWPTGRGRSRQDRRTRCTRRPTPSRLRRRRRLGRRGGCPSRRRPRRRFRF
mmetsp:Transcript_429/g.1223  ORF Transcript_429/g.1223 Transcript_429/m.1223 type:complete len:246 (+) Transcript_429:960-1697(+)